MTRQGAKKVLRAYMRYTKQAEARFTAEGAEYALAHAAWCATQGLSPSVLPALKVCGVTRDGAILELIEEALDGRPLGRPSRASREAAIAAFEARQAKR